MTIEQEIEKEADKKKLSAVDQLLHRSPKKEYIDEWVKFLEVKKETDLLDKTSGYMIFRLNDEYFAINSMIINQVTSLRSVHSIPHLKGREIKGTVNINGQLKLMICMHAILGLDHEDSHSSQIKSKTASLIVIENEHQVWCFAVSELFGIHHFTPGSMENIPVTLTKSSSNYLKNVVTWKEKTVGLLDEELLFFSLRRNLK